MNINYEQGSYMQHLRLSDLRIWEFSLEISAVLEGVVLLKLILDVELR